MLVDARKATLLIIDVQERLLPAMAEQERVVSKCKILIKAAEALAVPVTISEQYPKGLGHTVAELVTPAATVMEKTAFSCWRDATIKAHMINHHESGRPLVIVAGIEAHVCALQSCIDLAAAGFGVFAVCDAMSSRQAESARVAYDRLRDNQVQVITTEMAVFEMLEHAGTPQFKALSKLIK
jgi:nicotinamidase-related amidase